MQEIIQRLHKYCLAICMTTREEEEAKKKDLLIQDCYESTDETDKYTEIKRNKEGGREINTELRGQAKTVKKKN